MPFVAGGLRDLPLLPTEELRQVRAMGSLEVAGPQIVGFHHVQIAVEDQIAVACHIALRAADYLPTREQDEVPPECGWGQDDRPTFIPSRSA